MGHFRRTADGALAERQRAARELLVDGLAALARIDARIRPHYGAAASAIDGLSALEAAGEALSVLADIRYRELLQLQ